MTALRIMMLVSAIDSDSRTYIISNIVHFRAWTGLKCRHQAELICRLERCILDSLVKSAGRTSDHLQNVQCTCNLAWRLAQHCHPRVNFFSSSCVLAIAVLESNPLELKLCLRSTFGVFLSLRLGITVNPLMPIFPWNFCERSS